MSFAVGVDGGGTMARAVVVDASGRELGRGEAPGAVVDAGAPELAAAAVEGAVRAAVRTAGVSLPAAALWAGLAGAGREAGRTAVTRVLEGRGLAGRVLLGTDVEAAFHAAFGGTGEGLLLLAGTGSIAWGRDAAGGTWRAGGWGALVGDEGSGYAIGVAAVRAALRAADGRGRETRLRHAVPEAVAVPGPEALGTWAASATKSDLAGLVRVVVDAAAGGDAVAVALLDHAAADLVRHVEALVSKAPAGGGRRPLALGGGLLGEGGPLRARVVTGLAGQPVDVRSGAPDAALGAARLALEAI